MRGVRLERCVNWPRWIRTIISGSKVRRPAVGRGARTAVVLAEARNLTGDSRCHSSSKMPIKNRTEMLSTGIRTTLGSRCSAWACGRSNASERKSKNCWRRSAAPPASLPSVRSVAAIWTSSRTAGCGTVRSDDGAGAGGDPDRARRHEHHHRRRGPRALPGAGQVRPGVLRRPTPVGPRVDRYPAGPASAPVAARDHAFHGRRPDDQERRRSARWHGTHRRAGTRRRAVTSPRPATWCGERSRWHPAIGSNGAASTRR